jgi:endonuclease/exonuclease/phosphatase family metal-dependent hydrolase
MIRRLMSLALALVLVGCGAKAAEPVRLTVMTYNIHLGIGTDKKFDLQRIAKIINAHRPDFVAVQEVDQGTTRVGGIDEPAELARLTGLHATYGPAMDHAGGRYGNVVLSRRPVTSSRVVALPYKPGGRREPRTAVGVTCRVGGEEVVFIGTHFDHTGGEQSDRLAQAKAVNDAWGEEERPAVFAGDINCEPGTPPMEELARVWALASIPAPTSPAGAPRSAIDHVLVKPRDRWRVIKSRVIEEPVASDHRPVLVKMELIPTKR